jgi:hypothetical protein
MRGIDFVSHRGVVQSWLIERACRLIRSGWSPAERRQRRIAYADTARRAKSNPTPAHWTPPVISMTAEVAAALDV